MSGMLTSVRVRLPRTESSRPMPSLRASVARSRERAAMREYRRIVQVQEPRTVSDEQYYRALVQRRV